MSHVRVKDGHVYEVACSTNTANCQSQMSKSNAIDSASQVFNAVPDKTTIELGVGAEARLLAPLIVCLSFAHIVLLCSTQDDKGDPLPLDFYGVLGHLAIDTKTIALWSFYTTTPECSPAIA